MAISPLAQMASVPRAAPSRRRPCGARPQTGRRAWPPFPNSFPPDRDNMIHPLQQHVKATALPNWCVLPRVACPSQGSDPMATCGTLSRYNAMIRQCSPHARPASRLAPRLTSRGCGIVLTCVTLSHRNAVLCLPACLCMHPPTLGTRVMLSPADVMLRMSSPPLERVFSRAFPELLPRPPA